MDVDVDAAAAPTMTETKMTGPRDIASSAGVTCGLDEPAAGKETRKGVHRGSRRREELTTAAARLTDRSAPGAAAGGGGDAGVAASRRVVRSEVRRVRTDVLSPVRSSSSSSLSSVVRGIRTAGPPAKAKRPARTGTMRCVPEGMSAETRSASSGKPAAAAWGRTTSSWAPRGRG